MSKIFDIQIPFLVNTRCDMSGGSRDPKRWEPHLILILVVKWSVLVNIIMGFVNLKFKCQKYLIFKFALLSIQGGICHVAHETLNVGSPI